LVAKIIAGDDIGNVARFYGAGEDGIGIIVLEYEEVGHAAAGREEEGSGEVR
jgi:hypothetical protein